MEKGVHLFQDFSCYSVIGFMEQGSARLLTKYCRHEFLALWNTHTVLMTVEHDCSENTAVGPEQIVDH